MRHSSKCKSQVGTLFLSLALSIKIAGANTITIGTLDSWDGANHFTAPELGETPIAAPTAVASYGQSFITPVNGTAITDFSIFLFSYAFDPQLVFGGYLMQWDGHRATGPILYESGPITWPATAFGSWQEFTFSGVNVAVTPGQHYVFIISVSQYFNGARSADVGTTFNGDYTGGAMQTLDNGTDISKWTTENWQPGPFDTDLAFAADFDATPVEPPPEVPDKTNASLLAITAAFLVSAGLRRKYLVRT